MILTRKDGEKVILTIKSTRERIEMQIISVHGHGPNRKIRVGFTADPEKVLILREELMNKEDRDESA